MSDDHIRRLAVQQRKRLVAVVMSAAESTTWWPRLAREDQDAFRDKVLRGINGYHEFMLDVITVGGEDAQHSDEVLALLERIHASQLRVERGAAPVG